ncbi:hypothetical protein FRC01_012952, partial [Tulasnella sp. 417]
MPQMLNWGSLTTFLPSVNLLYAGIPKAPSAREVGECIFHLKKATLSTLINYNLAIDNPGKMDSMYSAAEKEGIDG